MAILPKIEEHEASLEVQATYAKIKARYGGFLPDIYKAFANDPEYLDPLNDHITRVLKPRKVDAKTKEVIALVVAAINNCDFCLNAHAGSLRGKYGYDDEAIAEVLATTALWSEVTRFNIAAGVHWSETQRSRRRRSTRHSRTWPAPAGRHCRPGGTSMSRICVFGSIRATEGCRPSAGRDTSTRSRSGHNCVDGR